MRRRERAPDGVLGGINADQMGLGSESSALNILNHSNNGSETIQMLANIVNGRPPRRADGRPYKGPKTTLIVATPSLCTQWGNEIATHTWQDRKLNWKPLKVLRYRARQLPLMSDPLQFLSSHDIL
jgi:SNF2 family DNA or RNA helicase